MESNNTKYAFDANSEALFKEADKLLDVAGPFVPDDSDQALPDIVKTPTLPIIRMKQYWQLL